MTGLVQPWQILGKMFARCLTTRATCHDQPPLQIMQMLYCFVNNLHVDYAELLWEGLHYALEHPSTQISYPRFTKLIVGHYMISFLEISRRVRDKYHNLEHDEMLTENYWLYAEAFGVDVPMTQFHIPPRWSTRLTPPTPVPTIAEVEHMTLQDTIQLSIAEQKSRDDFEVRQNVEKVNEHLVDKEIEKMVEGTENVDIDERDSSILNSQNDPDTSLDPGSYKETPKVEILAAKQPVNVIEEGEELVKDDYELRRRDKGKHVEESRNTPSPTPIRSPRIYSTLIYSDTEKLQELTKTNPTPSSYTPSSTSPKPTSSMSQHILSLFKTKTG
ncbi:hypothetical protein Tco_1253272 [Tanacetum coccineum]